MSLEAGQAKWNRKTAKAFREKWVRNFADARTFDEWVQGIAAATGLSPQQIASSLPAQNFREAQSNANAYLEKALRKIDAAARTGKWKQNFIRAFQ